jgi:hypothetical protein
MNTRIATALALCVIMAGPMGVSLLGDGPAVLDWLTTREVTIPAGTPLPIVLDTSVASNTSRVEQPVGPLRPPGFWETKKPGTLDGVSVSLVSSSLLAAFLPQYRLIRGSLPTPWMRTVEEPS